MFNSNKPLPLYFILYILCRIQNPKMDNMHGATIYTHITGPYLEPNNSIKACLTDVNTVFHSGKLHPLKTSHPHRN